MQLYSLENGKILACKHQISFWMNIRHKLQHEVIADFVLFHTSNACVCYILFIFPICHDAGGDDSADDDHGLIVDDPQQHLVMTTMLTMALVLVGMGRVCNEASRGLIFRIWPPPIHKFAVFLIR